MIFIIAALHLFYLFSIYNCAETLISQVSVSTSSITEQEFLTEEATRAKKIITKSSGVKSSKVFFDPAITKQVLVIDTVDRKNETMATIAKDSPERHSKSLSSTKSISESKEEQLTADESSATTIHTIKKSEKQVNSAPIAKRPTKPKAKDRKKAIWKIAKDSPKRRSKSLSSTKSVSESKEEQLTADESSATTIHTIKKSEKQVNSAPVAKQPAKPKAKDRKAIWKKKAEQVTGISRVLQQLSLAHSAYVSRAAKEKSQITSNISIKAKEEKVRVPALQRKPSTGTKLAASSVTQESSVAQASLERKNSLDKAPTLPRQSSLDKGAYSSAQRRRLARNRLRQKSQQNLGLHADIKVKTLDASSESGKLIPQSKTEVFVVKKSAPPPSMPSGIELKEGLPPKHHSSQNVPIPGSAYRSATAPKKEDKYLSMIPQPNVVRRRSAETDKLKEDFAKVTTNFAIAKKLIEHQLHDKKVVTLTDHDMQEAIDFKEHSLNPVSPTFTPSIFPRIISLQDQELVREALHHNELYKDRSVAQPAIQLTPLERVRQNASEASHRMADLMSGTFNKTSGDFS